ncbi:MAG: DivIVA domain-containing protein [Firmicutes bacterium]|nr:DivIVA domain-containing protein [Clostridiales bacterium]MBQ5954801.1 DivIVA domain-containing protein [Bacillota bacterium]MBQ6088366.1 DivIVA domain-containing protein [Bacillota bacterium]MBR3183933.1 DivIVA domain-containing protein [Bacillota bacterium]MBR3260073.1 DivIVA domain-containing protein [Bacillota bacterium]
MITPSDIENKEFRRVKKGFDPDEVDEFLDLIIVDMEKLIKENRRLKDELAKVSSQVDKHVNSESTVYETLAAAKQLMNDIAASAERRAEILLKNAELQADMITREAKENISRYTDEGNRLMSRVDLLRERYRSMLKDELDRVNEDNNDFFSEFRNDFMPASMQDLSDDDMKIRSREKNTETKTKVAEEKIDLTKTMVMKKGDL